MARPDEAKLEVLANLLSSQQSCIPKSRFLVASLIKPRYPYHFMHFTRLRRAFWQAFMHGQYSVAKAAAYSSILTLFPAFLVVTSILEASHNTEGFLQQISMAVRWVLPPGARSVAL